MARFAGISIRIAVLMVVNIALNLSDLTATIAIVCGAIGAPVARPVVRAGEAVLFAGLASAAPVLVLTVATRSLDLRQGLWLW